MTYFLVFLAGILTGGILIGVFAVCYIADVFNMGKYFGLPKKNPWRRKR